MRMNKTLTTYKKPTSPVSCYHEKKLIILLDILICLSAPFSVISFTIMLLYEIDSQLIDSLLLESVGKEMSFLMASILALIAGFPIILLTFKNELKK